MSIAEPRPHRLSPAALAPLALLGLALALAACNGGHSATPASGERVKVLAASPSGESYLPTEPIRIHFDRPVIAAERLGVPLAGDLPVAIEPAVALSARFTDRQTLVLSPAKPLAASTRYRVSLRGELGERTGHYAFDFVSVPLEVEGLWGIDTDELPARPKLPLHFNQPVAAEAVQKHCKIVDKDGKTVAIEARGGDNAVVEIEPGSDLALDSRFQLICSGLSGAAGSEPMDGIYALSLHTYPKLEVASIDPVGGEGAKKPIPADNTRFTIHFSTPMSRESLLEQVHFEPKADGSGRGWLSYDGKRYSLSAELEPKTHYRLVIGAEATDRFGQKLGKPYVQTFDTGNARPSISMQTGIYALETSKEGYPIWTRNVGEMSVACAEVPEKSIVKLLTSGMDYDPWYNAQQKTIKWDELGLHSRMKMFRPAAPENKWHLTRLELSEQCGGRQKRGLYLAEIKSPDLKFEESRRWAYRASRRVLANVTDLGVLLKAGTASGLVWVTSISDGKPVPGARVTLYSPRGRRVYRGTTDRSGLVSLPGTTKLLRQPGAGDAGHVDFESYRSQRMIAIVEKGGDRAVVDGNWANGIQTWNFGVDEDRKSGLTRIRGFIQSDRGIYRPGETVKFKGLLREYRGGRAPDVPRGKKIAVSITDARGSKIFDDQLSVSSFGGFHFEYPITPEAPLGDYVVAATMKGQTFRERFQVEEFRKVNFEIDVGGVERHQRLGQKMAFRGTARYLFGAPVSGAKLEWNVSRRPHVMYFPKKFPSYGFADYAANGYYGWWSYDAYHYADFVANGEGRTDAQGGFTFDVKDTSGQKSQPYDYIAQVTVTDDTDQAVSKRMVVTGHPSDFYLGLHAQEWVQAVGMPFAINAVAVHPDGTQIAHEAKLQLVRERRICSWTRRGYRSYSDCKNKHEVVLSRDVDIPKTGVATERIYPKKPGTYVIRLESTDGRGKKVASSTYVWVLGKGEAFWSGDESARMSVIASKAEYAPGETAKLVPRTGLEKPTALVTLERNGIIKSFVKEMDSAFEGIEVPLADSYAPNVFATVTMVSGRHGKGDRKRPRFKMGMVDLRIASEHKRLSVEVETDRKDYEPGETVRGVIRVRSRGKPVRAEVAVSAADEGVLQLIGYKTPDPMKSFYASWGMGIDNSTNWNRIARLDSPTGEDPDEGGDAGEAGDKVRSKFVNSAYWAPALVTNGRGEARFEFQAPDNLTAFRIMAVAADNGDRFGSSDSRITVSKPLLAKPVLPRFITEGDKVEVGVVVHNYTDSGGEVTVRASATGVALTPATKKVRVAAGGAERVRFYATAKNVLAARFKFALAMGKYKDGLELEVPVKRPVVMEDKVLASGTIDRRGEVSVPIAWAAGADNLASTVTVTVDRLGMSELEPALRQLIEYPYGCLEQTLSRFIPLTKVKDLAASLGMDKLRGPRLQSFLRAGAAKVVRFQHADGNYSLWPGGETYPHLTVYATYGLLQARRAKVHIDEAAYRRGIAAIKKYVNHTSTTEMDLGTAAMGAYLLAEAGQADAGLDARLFAQRQGMPIYGRGFLLMAMKLAKADDKLREQLLREIIDARNGGLFTESMPQSELMGSDIRTTAIALMALLMEDPSHPEVDRLAAVLKKNREPAGYWGSTQENIFSLIALADYARQRSAGSSRVTVSLGGDRLGSERLRGGKVLSFTRGKPEAGEKTIKITSAGRASYTVRVRQGLPLEASKPASAGFTVERELLDPKTSKPVTRLEVGQVLIERVKIKTDKTRHWVALVDPLPAGLEAVNTKLATSRRDAPSQAEKDAQRDWWWRNRWDHIELRDDEARAFRDTLPAGESVLIYRVRVSLPGKYTALPAHAEEMYEPQVMGRSASRQLEVLR